MIIKIGSERIGRPGLRVWSSESEMSVEKLITYEENNQLYMYVLWERAVKIRSSEEQSFKNEWQIEWHFRPSKFYMIKHGVLLVLRET